MGLVNSCGRLKPEILKSAPVFSKKTQNGDNNSVVLTSFEMLAQGRIQDFFRRGCTRLLLYFNTNKPHSFFFGRIPVVLENRRSSQGRGGCAPPHPPPRSAPVAKRAETRKDTVSVLEIATTTFKTAAKLHRGKENATDHGLSILKFLF